MLDAFIAIRGPDFLSYYAILVAVLLVLGWFWGTDDSQRHPMPKLTRFDALSIASLEGIPSVIRTALFGLWSRNKITIHQSGKDNILEATGSAQEASDPIERAIMNFLNKPRNISSIFKDKEIRQAIQLHQKPIVQELERAHLLRKPEEKGQAWKSTWMVLVILLGIGGLKAFFGVYYGYPIAFLVIEIIIATILVFVVNKPWRIISRLGRSYQKKLKEHFDWARTSAATGQIPNGIDPSFAIALYGTSILVGHGMYSPFFDTFKKSSSSSGGYSGCGGCSGSGCSGGGCSGGCGGGCGGCGG